MKILGLSKGRTNNNKELRDGGAAILEDGIVKIVLSEERISRKRRAGGFNYCYNLLNEYSLLDDLDYIAVSTCCEPADSALMGHSFEGYKNLYPIGHHESHAWGAFSLSNFKEALVIVIDGGGNTLENHKSKNWYELPREQHSYYIARDNKLELIDRDFYCPYDVGFGEMFRAASYFLGWPSSKYSGKVMALSSYGEKDNLTSKRIYELQSDGQLVGQGKYYSDPAKIITELGNKTGVYFGESLLSSRDLFEITRGYIDFAAFIQWNVETAFIEKVRWLIDKTNLKNICLSGGFLLNCVVNGKLAAEKKINDIYVSPAPGDHGQCLGNAIALWHKFAGSRVNCIYQSSQCFLGVDYSRNINSKSISRVLIDKGYKDIVILEPRDSELAVAKLISLGNAVATFQHRGEFGLRALGNHSILMRADKKENHHVVSEIKEREWFQPFAPAILDNDFKSIFGNLPKSPFMSFAYPVPDEYLDLFAGTISNSKRARIQTVDENCFLGKILLSLKKLGSPPVCLNTSFNGKDQPIVETLSDAFEAFETMPINALSIGRFIGLKILDRNIFQSNLVSLSPPSEIIVDDNQELHYLNDSYNSVEIIRYLQRLTKSVIFIRSDFSLFGDYLTWLKSGKKTTTIRWRSGGVEYPINTILPLREATDNNRVPPLEQKPLYVKIRKIQYKRFGDLSEKDAKTDGFESREQMYEHFTKRIYPNIKKNDWVAIYHLDLLDHNKSTIKGLSEEEKKSFKKLEDNINNSWFA